MKYAASVFKVEDDDYNKAYAVSGYGRFGRTWCLSLQDTK